MEQKIDIKGGWKNDEKMMMTRMAKKSDLGGTPEFGTTVLSPGEEGGGGLNPSSNTV